MNNIYVDELPDCCGNCSLCCKDDLGYWCQATTLIYVDERFVAEKRLNSCPLKPLTDRLAEERKKVVQEIKDEIVKLKRSTPNHDIGYDCDDVLLSYLEISEILDQIERGKL